jgi:hypothetical protein
VAMLAQLAAFEGAQRPPRLDASSLRRDAFCLEPRLDIVVAERSDSEIVAFVAFHSNCSSWAGASRFSHR